MLDFLTRQLLVPRAEAYKLLSSTLPKVKASKSEIKALHERYSEGLNLLKQIALQLQDCKSLLRYKTHSELLDKNNTD